MPYSLNIKLPADIQARLNAIQAILLKRTGGIPMPFTKVVLHVLKAGLPIVEKEVADGQ